VKISLCANETSFLRINKINSKVVIYNFFDIKLTVSVEELVSRLRYINVIMGYYWLLTLCKGASVDAADFFNVRKKVVNVILWGVHFGPIIEETSRTLSRFYLNSEFK